MNLTPQINLDYLERTFDSDKIIIHKILNSFIDNTPQLIKDLSEHISQGNKEDVIMIAHKMKTSFNTLGATEVGTLLSKIELEAASSNVQSLSNMVEKVKELNEQVLKEVKEELNK